MPEYVCVVLGVVVAGGAGCFGCLAYVVEPGIEGTFPYSDQCVSGECPAGPVSAEPWLATSLLLLPLGPGYDACRRGDMRFSAELS